MYEIKTGEMRGRVMVFCAGLADLYLAFLVTNYISITH